jgi:hypothetical protein
MSGLGAFIDASLTKRGQTPVDKFSRWRLISDINLVLLLHCRCLFGNEAKARDKAASDQRYRRVSALLLLMLHSGQNAAAVQHQEIDVR